MQYISHSVSDTEAFGRQLAQQLHSNTVVACRGGLGMGKTALTRGIAQGLGYTGRVTSPTFTIVNEYLGETPLFHFDMYRLDDIWSGAVCAWWNGARTWRMRCRPTPSS